MGWGRILEGWDRKAEVRVRRMGWKVKGAVGKGGVV